MVRINILYSWLHIIMHASDFKWLYLDKAFMFESYQSLFLVSKKRFNFITMLSPSMNAVSFDICDGDGEMTLSLLMVLFLLLLLISLLLLQNKMKTT